MADIPKAPRLQSFSRTCVVLFEQEYQAYKRAIDAYNIGRAKELAQAAKKRCECVDMRLLEALQDQEGSIEAFSRAEADARRNGDDFTEAIDLIELKLTAFLKATQQCDTYEVTTESLREALRAVRIDLSVPNISARVIMFIAQLRTVLKEQGIDMEVCRDPSKFGRIARILAEEDDCLKPLEIRAMLLTELTGLQNDQMTLTQLNKLLQKYYVYTDFLHRMRLQIRYFGLKRKRLQPSQAQSGHKRRKINDETSKNEVKSKKEATEPVHRANRKCWGCGEDHHLQHCPKITDANERRDIVLQRWPNKRLGNKRESSSYNVSNCIYDTSVDMIRTVGVEQTSANVMILFNDDYKTSCVLDSGSDRSIISRDF